MSWWGDVENSINELGGKWKEFAFCSDSDSEVLMVRIEANRMIHMSVMRIVQKEVIVVVLTTMLMIYHKSWKFMELVWCKYMLSRKFRICILWLMCVNQVACSHNSSM